MMNCRSSAVTVRLFFDFLTKGLVYSISWFEARMKNSSIEVNYTFDDNVRIHTYIVKHDDICEIGHYT